MTVEGLSSRVLQRFGADEDVVIFNADGVLAEVLVCRAGEDAAGVEIEPGHVGTAEDAVAVFDAGEVHEVVGVRASGGEGVPHPLVVDDANLDAIDRKGTYEAILEICHSGNAVELGHGPCVAQ
jgi:hypothetical protein